MNLRLLLHLVYLKRSLPQSDGSFLIEGSANIRDINKGLQWTLPTDGPRTLNGLILEHLEDIPESHLSVQVASHPMEIVVELGNRKPHQASTRVSTGS